MEAVGEAAHSVDQWRSHDVSPRHGRYRRADEAHAAEGRRRDVRVLAALVVPSAIVAIAMLLAPSIAAGPTVTAAVTFFGAAAVAMLGLALGARLPLSRRQVIVVDVCAVLVIAGLALARVRSPWMCPVV